jgi:hypothetical protein
MWWLYIRHVCLVLCLLSIRCLIMMSVVWKLAGNGCHTSFIKVVYLLSIEFECYKKIVVILDVCVSILKHVAIARLVFSGFLIEGWGLYFWNSCLTPSQQILLIFCLLWAVIEVSWHNPKLSDGSFIYILFSLFLVHSYHHNLKTK